MVRAAPKRALLIVDVQPAFLRRGGAVVDRILTLLRSTEYDVYVAAVFHAERGSRWDVQTGWVCPEDERTRTVPAILSLLPASTVYVDKTSITDPSVLCACGGKPHTGPTVTTAEASSILGYAALYVSAWNLPPVT
jgi:hypothetical protein